MVGRRCYAATNKQTLNPHLRVSVSKNSFSFTSLRGKVPGMGIGFAVHGFIAAPGWYDQEPSLRVFTHNKAVIQSLPELDKDWPFIVRSMFALSPYRTKLEVSVPQYEHMLIHFAASYKDMYLLSADWILKFEAILKKLCAQRAVVYCDIGTRYEWHADWPSEDFLRNPPLLPRKWVLKCYEGGSKEIPYIEAIDGAYPQ